MSGLNLACWSRKSVDPSPRRTDANVAEARDSFAARLGMLCNGFATAAASRRDQIRARIDLRKTERHAKEQPETAEERQQAAARLLESLLAASHADHGAALEKHARVDVVSQFVRDLSSDERHDCLHLLRAYRTEIQALLLERYRSSDATIKRTAAILADDLNLLRSELVRAEAGDNRQSTSPFDIGEYEAALRAVVNAIVEDQGTPQSRRAVREALDNAVACGGASRALSGKALDAYNDAVLGVLIRRPDRELALVHAWFERERGDAADAGYRQCIGQNNAFAARELSKLRSAVASIEANTESARQSKAKLRAAFAVPCLAAINQALRHFEDRRFESIAPYSRWDTLEGHLLPPAFSTEDVRKFAALHGRLEAILQPRLVDASGRKVAVLKDNIAFLESQADQLVSLSMEQYGALVTHAKEGSLTPDVVRDAYAVIDAAIERFAGAVRADVAEQANNLPVLAKAICDRFVVDETGFARLRDSQFGNHREQINTLIAVLNHLAVVQGATRSRGPILDDATVAELLQFLTRIAHQLSDSQRRLLMECGGVHHAIPDIAMLGETLQRGMRQLQHPPASPAALLRTIKDIADSGLALQRLAGMDDAVAAKSDRAGSAAPGPSWELTDLRGLFRFVIGEKLTPKAIAALQDKMHRADYMACHHAVGRLADAVKPFVDRQETNASVGALSDEIIRWNASYGILASELAAQSRRPMTSRPVDLQKYRRLVEKTLKDAYGLMVSVDKDRINILGSLGTEYFVKDDRGVHRARLVKAPLTEAQLDAIKQHSLYAKEGGLSERATLVFPQYKDSRGKPHQFTVAEQWAADVGRCDMQAGNVLLSMKDVNNAELPRVSNPPEASGAKHSAKATIVRTSNNGALYRFMQSLLALCDGDHERLFRATQQMNQAFQSGAYVALTMEDFGSFGRGEPKLFDSDRGSLPQDNVIKYVCSRRPDGGLGFTATMELPRINAVVRDDDLRGLTAESWLDSARSAFRIQTSWVYTRSGKIVLDDKRPCERSYVLVLGRETHPASEAVGH
ncbi:hypothetical protein J5T34_11710 [Cupriavidus gilardii]|uniref:hypothetical protein n=1 Tax=Cupriavidus gilardii TaxID=82541 RepID=UPI001ABDEA3B|nr:hypothetical protein [Cupriavidus gilardii]MBO4121390.1 hypothetical protein [Cupriavidus gilardii]